jgi:uncharacterized protein YaiL (DUF2058 family)
MSLKDQLLKAGLVSKKQAQKSESQKRKQEHDSKKNLALAQVLNAEKQRELEAIEQEARERQERDKELNKQRDSLMAQREYLYRSLQLINSNTLNTRDASECYFFQEGRFVRKILVTAWQREMLARGKFAIARPHEEIDEFVLLPLSCAKLIQEIYPSKLLLLHSELDDFEDIVDSDTVDVI